MPLSRTTCACRAPHCEPAVAIERSPQPSTTAESHCPSYGPPLSSPPPAGPSVAPSSAGSRPFAPSTTSSPPSTRSSTPHLIPATSSTSLASCGPSSRRRNGSSPQPLPHPTTAGRPVRFPRFLTAANTQPCLFAGLPQTQACLGVWTSQT